MEAVHLYNWKRPVRLLEEEIHILSTLNQNIIRLFGNTFKIQTGLNVSIEGSEPNILTARELIPNLSTDSIYFCAKPENKFGFLFLFFDEATVSVLVTSLFGGSLSRASERIPRKNKQLTDFELTVLERVFLRMIGIIREGLNTDLDLILRLYYIREELQEFSRDIGDGELGLCFPFQMIWSDADGNRHESKCNLYYTQDFLRNTQWRQGKWQNLAR